MRHSYLGLTARGLVLLFIVCLPALSWGQEAPSLAVRVESTADSVDISWFPSTAEGWAATRSGGFILERFIFDATSLPSYENPDVFWSWVDDNGTGQTLETIKTSEADTATLATNALVGGGVVGAIKALLYDETFRKGDIAEVLERQYEMVAFGAFQIGGRTAELLGTRYLDKEIEANKALLYRIISVDRPDIVQEVVVEPLGRAYVRMPAELTVDHSQNPFLDLAPPLPTEYEFQVGGRAFGDSIVVRWAPEDALLLRQSHKMGYYIERIPLTDDSGNDLSNIVADTIYILPWPQEFITEYFEGPEPAVKDSAVLIAAQILYGDLQVNNDTDRADALQNQLAFGLQAAESSVMAAGALGLRYVDYDVEPGATYEYTVHMPMNLIDSLAFPVFDYIQIENDYKGITPLTTVVAAEGEYSIEIIMDAANGEEYGTYFYERSDDGGQTWRALNEYPVAFEAEEEFADLIETYTFTDKVPELYVPYQYRVRGQNSFGQKSPWIELTAMARDRTPPSVPVPDTIYLVTENTAHFEWDGEITEQYPDLAGYYVKLGETAEVENQEIVSELIPPGTFVYDYQLPEGVFNNDRSYFFQISAVDTAGNVSNSFPMALNIIDSIAPEPPVGLVGSIDDDTGIATIAWESSPENDVLGYQVYFSDDTTDVFSQITTEDLEYNLYLDTVELNTMNDVIYYRVTAYDQSYNMSDFSEILIVQRPDVVPPTPPLQLLPNPTGAAIELSWEPSSSDDATTYRILRRSNELIDGDFEPWQLIDSVPATELAFADTSAAYEVAYQYMILTVDDADLVSDDGNLQTGRRIFTADVGGVGGVTVSLAETATEGEARVQVQWTYEKPSIPLLRDADHRFMLYRAVGDDVLTRYKQLRSKEPLYLDTAVDRGKTYRYALMVVYDNGKKSSLSDDRSVTIPDSED